MARVLISAAVILLVAHPKFQNVTKSRENANYQVASSATDSTDLTQDLSFPPRTKSKERIVHRKPTLAETTDLLRNTIIPRVEIEDQSVGETANTLRLLIQEAGIHPHELRIICDMAAPSSAMRIRELRIRNIPLAVLLKYICDSTKLRYHLTPGVIEFKSISERFERAESDEPDPFEEPETPKPLLDPDDPFYGIE